MKTSSLPVRTKEPKIATADNKLKDGTSKDQPTPSRVNTSLKYVKDKFALLYRNAREGKLLKFKGCVKRPFSTADVMDNAHFFHGTISL